MTTYPLPTLGCTIDATGISAPEYSDILLSLQASFQGIYGSDVYLGNDSQDGQMLAVFAKGYDDCNKATIAAYNAFSPASAQGAGLSSVVKINGLQREIATNSTAVVTVGGPVGTTITNGLVGDNQSLGTEWALPASVVIDGSCTATVTATCTDEGAITAAIGTLTKILNPQNGWQSVTNASAATPGESVELDARLRQRQSVSTALPSQSIIDAISAVVENLPGVNRVKVYQNNTGSTDANGIPAHTFCLVVDGGDVVQIATAIATKKNPGPGMFGSISETVTDPAGIVDTILFDALGTTALDIVITGTALTGYVNTTAPLLQAALSQFVSGLGIGDDSLIGWLWAPASLQGDDAIAGVSAALGQTVTQQYLDVLRKTFKITAVTQCLHGGSPTAADVAIAFNNQASAPIGNITVNIT